MNDKALSTTMCIVHAGFRGFQVFVARKKNRCKLTGNRFVIPHDTIHSTLAVIEMKRTLTLIILGLVLITGCSEQSPVIKDKQPQPEKHNHFIGIWESLERDIPFGATLTINADSSFQYDFGACMTHGMSEGFWQLDGDELVLNSGNDDSCRYTSEFGVDCIPIDSADSKLANRTLSKSDCAPKSSEYFVLFNNDRFQIVKDTLIHQFDQPKLCPEIRNDFKKKTTANNVYDS